MCPTSHKSYKPGRIAGNGQTHASVKVKMVPKGTFSLTGCMGCLTCISPVWVVSVACTDTPRSLGEIPNMRSARTWYLPHSRGVVYR